MNTDEHLEFHGKSLANRVLLLNSLVLSLIIIGATIVGYYQIKHSIEHQTTESIERYIKERTARESLIFKEAISNHKMIKKTFLEDYSNTSTVFSNKMFTEIAKVYTDSVYRNRQEYFNPNRVSGIYINPSVRLTDDIKKKIVVAYNISTNFGLALHFQFGDTYIFHPDGFMVLYWPEVGSWVYNTPKSYQLSAQEYSYIADLKHNPETKTVWTKIYFDSSSSSWIVSCVTPVYKDNSYMFTIGNDIVLDELMLRLKKNKFYNSDNFIFRKDGILIAGNQLDKQIRKSGGTFSIKNSDNDTLKAIYEIASRNGEQTTISRLPIDGSLIAVSKISGPDWLYVIKIPDSIIDNPSKYTANTILLIGLFLILTELIVLYYTFKKRVRKPLMNLLVGIQKFKNADSYHPVQIQSNDEIGWLAANFNQMQEAIIERDDYNRILFENSPIPLVILDPETMICLDCNNAAVKMYDRREKSEVVGKSPGDFSAEIQYNGVRSEVAAELHVKEAISEGSTNFIWRHKNHDNKIWDADVILSSFILNGKSLLQFTIKDISEKLLMEKALKESEEHLRITLMSIGDAVISTDIHGNVVAMNPIAEKLTGWKSSWAKGQPLTKVFKIINAITRDVVKNPVETVLATGKIVGLANHTILISKEGYEHQIADSAAPIINDYGKTLGVVLVFRDVTHEYQLREDARQQEEIFKTVFEISPFSMFIQRAKDAKYIMVNNSFLKNTGFSYDEVIEKTDSEIGLATNDSKREYISQQIREFGFVNNVIINTNKKDGSDMVNMFSSKLINLRDELCIFSISIDITETTRLQEQLHHNQKMEAVGKLAGGIAHDFNNMLAGILGSAELLLISDNVEDKNKFLKIIIESSQRAANLTKKLLTFGRKGKIEMKNVELHKIVEESVELLSHTLDKKISISKELSAGISQIMADSSQLINVILNLGLNAGYAMPDGGSLVFKTKTVTLNEDYCYRSSFKLSPGEYIQLDVIDSGCGIAPENLNKIFDPFFTTKSQGEGTGLGLSTVYGTIQQHNAAITVESRVGEGTVFHLFFKIMIIPTTANSNIETPVSGKGTILLVDDEEVIRITTKAILEGLGYNLLTAENGRSGLNIYKENEANIDLVILDMIMPEMNGKEVFFAIREHNPNAKIMLSSGFAQSADIEALRKAGLNGYIMKPFNTLKLSKLVYSIINDKEDV